MVTQAAGASPAAKNYDDKGFLITTTPATPTSSSPEILAAGQSSGGMLTPTPIGVAAGRLSAQKALGVACGIMGAALLV